MAVEIATLGIDLDSGKIKIGTTELAKLRHAADEAADALDDAGSRGTRSVDSLAEAARIAKAAFVTLGVGVAVRNVVAINDQYAQIEGRLRLVTDSTEELAQVQEDLFQIAQRTGSAYEGVASLYTRVARNAAELGLSQAEMLDLTEATNQAIQIGGASTQEAAAGVQQFSQALASGELRGDEFRSVMENMPRLAQAIADSLGVNIGQLRKMAAEGELSADVVTRALLSRKDELAREFAQLPVTVGRAMTELENEVKRAIAGADTGPLTDAIRDLKDQLGDPAIVEGISTISGALVTLASWAASAATGVAGVTTEVGELAAELAVGDASFKRWAALTMLANPATISSGISILRNELREAKFAMGEFSEQADPVIEAVSSVYETMRSLKHEEENAAIPLRSVTETLIPFRAGLDNASVAARKSATANDENAKAIKRANDAAGDRAEVLERTRELILQGADAEIASMRAKLEHDGVEQDLINSIIQSTKWLKSHQDQLAADKKATEDATREAHEYAAALESVAEGLERDKADLRLELAQEQRLYELLTLGLDVDTARAKVAREFAQYRDNETDSLRRQIDTQKGLTKTVLDGQIAEQREAEETKRREEEHARELQEAYRRSAEGIEDVFREVYGGIFDGFDGLADRLKSGFEDLLVEMALIATRNAVIVPIVSSIGGALGFSESTLSGVTGALGGNSPLTGLLGGAGATFGAEAVGAIGDAIFDLGGLLGSETVDAIGRGISNNATSIASSLATSIGGALAAYGAFEFTRSIRPDNSRLGSSEFGLLGLSTYTAPLAALDSLTGGSVFGTRYRTIAENLTISIEDGVVDAMLETVQKKKKSLGRGSRRRTLVDELTAEDSFLGGIISDIEDGVRQAFNRLNGIADSLGDRSLFEGLSFTGDIKGIEDGFGHAIESITDDMVLRLLPVVGHFQQEGEALVQTLIRVVNETASLQVHLGAVNESFRNIGGSTQLFRTGNLAEQAGGFDVLGSLVDQFLQGFYTEAERTAIAAEQLNNELGALGLAVPESAAAYRELVNSIEVVDEASGDLLLDLLRLGPLFLEVAGGAQELTSVMEELALADEGFAALGSNIQRELIESLDLSDRSLGEFGEALASLRARAEDAERGVGSYRDFARVLGDAGVSEIPRSSEAFSSLVSQLDLTSTSGLKLASSVIQMQASFEGFYGNLSATQRQTYPVGAASHSLSLGALGEQLSAQQNALANALEGDAATANRINNSIENIQGRINFLNSYTPNDILELGQNQIQAGAEAARRREAELEMQYTARLREEREAKDAAAASTAQLILTLDGFRKRAQDAFLPLEELAALRTNEFAGAVRALGLAVPETGAEFLALGDDILPLTDQFIELLRLQEQLAQVGGETAEAQIAAQERQLSLAQDLRDYVAGLDRSEYLGDPTQQLDETLRQFRDARNLAFSGDLAAGASLTGLADELIPLAREVFGSAESSADIIAEVRDSLTSVAAGLELPGPDTETLTFQRDTVAELREQNLHLAAQVRLLQEGFQRLIDVNERVAQIQSDMERDQRLVAR